ncbi:unnamed protein product, partial [Prorocentrum cordatum]
HLEEWAGEVKEEAEEVCAFGKFATRGAVRFKTEESMWMFFDSAAGKKHFHARGETIYANPHGLRDPNPKTTAVQKGTDAKKQIDTNHSKGRVRWKDRRVAERVKGEGKMKLMGEAEGQDEDGEKMEIERCVDD